MIMLMRDLPKLGHEDMPNGISALAALTKKIHPVKMNVVNDHGHFVWRKISILYGKTEPGIYHGHCLRNPTFHVLHGTIFLILIVN